MADSKEGERGARPGNQDLHFSGEIGFAIKGFGIKFNSAGAPARGYFDLVVV